MSDESITIKVKTIDSREHSVKVNLKWKVSELKTNLHSLLAVPIDRMRLIAAGRVMKDDQTLESLRLTEGTTVHLVARPADATGPPQADVPPQPHPPVAGMGGIPTQIHTVHIQLPMQPPPPLGPPITGITLHVHVNLAELDTLPARLQSLATRVNFQVPTADGVRVETAAPAGTPAHVANTMAQQVQQAVLPLLQSVMQGVQNAGVAVPPSLQGMMSAVQNAVHAVGGTATQPSLQHIAEQSGFADLHDGGALDDFLTECMRHVDMSDVMRIMGTGDWSAASRLYPVFLKHIMKVAKDRTPEGRQRAVAAVVKALNKALEDPEVRAEVTSRQRPSVNFGDEARKVITVVAHRLVDFILDSPDPCQPDFGAKLRVVLVRCVGLLTEYISSELLTNSYSDFVAMTSRVMTVLSREALASRPDVLPMWGMASNIVVQFIRVWHGEYAAQGRYEADAAEVRRVVVPPIPSASPADEDVDALLNDALTSTYAAPVPPPRSTTTTTTTVVEAVRDSDRLTPQQRDILQQTLQRDIAAMAAQQGPMPPLGEEYLGGQW